MRDGRRGTKPVWETATADLRSHDCRAPVASSCWFCLLAAMAGVAGQHSRPGYRDGRDKPAPSGRMLSQHCRHPTARRLFTSVR